MSGLPREILRWMQSLDLSFSVKNVKRDFSNGFLIAEIFSRYFKQDVQMHSYDNGTSIQRKKDNWALLEKFFKKNNIQIDKQLIEDVIHCKAGASIPLIEKVYMSLTNKQIAPIRPTQDAETAPSFARPTASSLVKDRMNDPDVKSSADVQIRTQEAEKVLKSYNDSLKQERANDTQKNLAATNPRPPPLRVPTRRVGKEETATIPIQFKKVEVKQIDANIAQLRQTKMASKIPTSALSPAASERSTALASSGPVGASGAMGRVSKPTMDVLNRCVLSKLEGTEHLKRFDPRKDAILAFMDSLKTFPEQVAAQVIADINQKATDLCAENALASPKEFWLFFGLFHNGLTNTPAASKTFSAIVNFLINVGHKMLQKESMVPWALMTDFALPKVLQTARVDQTKVRGLVRVVMAYCPPLADDRIKALSTIREYLQHDMVTYLKILAGSVLSIVDINAELIHMYLDEATSALRSDNGVARSAVMALLAGLARVHGGEYKAQVLDFTDELLASLDKEEEAASAVYALCSLLSVMGSEEERFDKIVDTIVHKVHSRSSEDLQEAALTCLPLCLHADAELRRKFVEIIDGNTSALESALAAEEGVIGDLPSIRECWYPITLFQTVAEDIRESNKDNINPAVCQLLADSLLTVDQFPDSEMKEWAEVFEATYVHLGIEFVDEQACTHVAYIFSRYLLEPRTQEEASKLFTGTGGAPLLLGVMKAIYPEAPSFSQSNFITFMQDVSKGSPDVLAPLVAELLRQFAEAYPINVKQAPQLQAFIEASAGTG